MSIPEKVEQLLVNNSIDYRTVTLADIIGADDSTIIALRPSNIVRAVALKDESKEYLIAIVRNDRVLDLEQLNRLYNDKYTPLTGGILDRFMLKYGSLSIPALPNFNDLTSVVDKTILDHDHVFLDVGSTRQYIELKQDDFRSLLGDAKVSAITKPLNQSKTETKNPDIRQKIEESVSLFTKRRIKNRLEETLEFPLLPHTAKRIINLRSDPHADISDLTEIVELDASLSAQVVSWAASPYYSAPGSIRSIHDAIVRVLGFDMVLNLALGLSLGKTMNMPESGPHSVLPYWQQSVYVAAATETLVSCIPRKLRPSFGTAYLSGLLNNFGYLIISEVFTSQFQTICQHIDANPQISNASVDRQIIGVDRNQLAVWLMQYWHMPEAVQIALRYQDDPDYDGAEWEYPAIIYLAKQLIQAEGLDMGAANDIVDKQLFTRLNLNMDEAKAAIAKLLDAQSELQAIAKQMEA